MRREIEKENAMKDEDLPEKFRLKFRGEYYFFGKLYNILGNPEDFTYSSKGICSWDPLLKAMIEKGVLEVEDLTVEKRWRVFMKIETGAGVIYYGTFGFDEYWFYDAVNEAEEFTSLAKVREHFPNITVKDVKLADGWTIYAEEFEVKK